MTSAMRNTKPCETHGAKTLLPRKTCWERMGCCSSGPHASSRGRGKPHGPPTWALPRRSATAPRRRMSAPARASRPCRRTPGRWPWRSRGTARGAVRRRACRRVSGVGRAARCRGGVAMPGGSRPERARGLGQSGRGRRGRRRASRPARRRGETRGAPGRHGRAPPCLRAWMWMPSSSPPGRRGRGRRQPSTARGASPGTGPRHSGAAGAGRAPGRRVGTPSVPRGHSAGARTV